MREMVISSERAILKEDSIIFDGKIYFILSEKEKVNFKHYGDELFRYVCFGNKHICEFEFLDKTPPEIYSYSYIDDRGIVQLSLFDSYGGYDGS